MLCLVVCSDIILVLRHLLVKGCTNAMPTKSQGLKWPFKQIKTYHTTSTMHYGDVKWWLHGWWSRRHSTIPKGTAPYWGEGPGDQFMCTGATGRGGTAQIVWIHLRTLHSIQNVRFELLYTGEWAQCRSSLKLTVDWLLEYIHNGGAQLLLVEIPVDAGSFLHIQETHSLLGDLTQFTSRRWPSHPPKGQTQHTGRQASRKPNARTCSTLMRKSPDLPHRNANPDEPLHQTLIATFDLRKWPKQRILTADQERSKEFDVKWRLQCWTCRWL